MTHASHHHHAHCDHGGKTAVDPVCGMKVDPAATPHHAEHAATVFHFCSAGCRTRFVADPARYLEPPQAAAVPLPAGTIYTCPMHPDVRQVGHGSCPICGMALEPELITADSGPNPELADMSRRFWIGLVLALPVVVLEMGGHLFDLHRYVAAHASNWLQLALATPVVLWAGWPFFERGWASLKSRNLNMFTLVAMGIGVAWAYSIAATVAPQMFPPAFRRHAGFRSTNRWSRASPCRSPRKPAPRWWAARSTRAVRS